MIAAGTGINPMIQLIRDYQQSFDSHDSTTGRSRMALLHQVTSASDLYCDKELCALKARGRGLLEIMILVSDNHRKTNNPKNLKTGAGRDKDSSSDFKSVQQRVIKPKALSRPSSDLVQGAHDVLPRASVLPSAPSCSSSMALEQKNEKLSKLILREVFGKGLMHTIEVFNGTHSQSLGTSHEGVERSGLEADLAALYGTETEPGKLQVVVSGPRGFVFMVKHMLEEMEVPKEAVVFLD